MTNPAPPEPIRPRAAETEAAVRSWMTYELTQGTARAYDLGKFLFTVAIGTAGLIAALLKDMKQPWIGVAAMIACILAAGVALDLAWPQVWSLGGHTDLLARYNTSMGRSMRLLKIWTFAYAVAFGLSVAAILSRT
ncbi:hypothetical membrane protein [Sorangium cellulosum So ce56]|uniref:Hypothetical membrane protein n=1 Tax=Sorangium cellulosum (strain So ce56) TaxID=448385 RepID=A9GSX7_SORC5|nr:hypothetical protein [Sorangium cellulosum]CAN96870.1 hypothetical membrane protein [Sorangium cellulosum So ce56]